MSMTIQMRRDTAVNWAAKNPVLSQGEIGMDTDVEKIKIGNGSTAWSGLKFLVDGGSTSMTDNGDGTVTVSGATGIGTSMYATKTADQSITSSVTFVLITDLTAAVLLGGVYKFEYFLIYEGPSAGDIKILPSFPATSSCDWTALGPSTGVAAGATTGSATFSYETETSAGRNIGTADAGFPMVITVRGYLTAAANGTLGMQFAQFVSTGTPTIVHAKSRMHVIRVA